MDFAGGIVAHITAELRLWSLPWCSAIVVISSPSDAAAQHDAVHTRSGHALGRLGLWF